MSVTDLVTLEHVLAVVTEQQGEGVPKRLSGGEKELPKGLSEVCCLACKQS